MVNRLKRHQTSCNTTCNKPLELPALTSIETTLQREGNFNAQTVEAGPTSQDNSSLMDLEAEPVCSWSDIQLEVWDKLYSRILTDVRTQL